MREKYLFLGIVVFKRRLKGRESGPAKFGRDPGSEIRGGLLTEVFGFDPVVEATPEKQPLFIGFIAVHQFFTGVKYVV